MLSTPHEMPFHSHIQRLLRAAALEEVRTLDCYLLAWRSPEYTLEASEVAQRVAAVAFDAAASAAVAFDLDIQQSSLAGDIDRHDSKVMSNQKQHSYCW